MLTISWQVRSGFCHWPDDHMARTCSQRLSPGWYSPTSLGTRYAPRIVWELLKLHRATREPQPKPSYWEGLAPQTWPWPMTSLNNKDWLGLGGILYRGWMTPVGWKSLKKEDTSFYELSFIKLSFSVSKNIHFCLWSCSVEYYKYFTLTWGYTVLGWLFKLFLSVRIC